MSLFLPGGPLKWSDVHTADTEGRSDRRSFQRALYVEPLWSPSSSWPPVSIGKGATVGFSGGRGLGRGDTALEMVSREPHGALASFPCTSSWWTGKLEGRTPFPGWGPQLHSQRCSNFRQESISHIKAARGSGPLQTCRGDWHLALRLALPSAFQRCSHCACVALREQLFGKQVEGPDSRRCAEQTAWFLRSRAHIVLGRAAQGQVSRQEDCKSDRWNPS